MTLCREKTRIIILSNTLFLGNSCTNGLLQKAAKSGNFPVVKFLQENGANVNATTRDDTNPPLVHAAREGFFRWSYLLYQIGIRQGFKVNLATGFSVIVQLEILLEFFLMGKSDGSVVVLLEFLC